MDYVLDILQGAGLALACGVNPFLTALLAGALASADLGLDFDGTAFAFLEASWFLAVMALALVASFLLRARFERPPVEAAIGGLAIGLGRSAVRRLARRPLGRVVARAARRRRLRCADGRRGTLDPAAHAPPPRRPGRGRAAAVLGRGSGRRRRSQRGGPPLALLALAFFARLLAGGKRREGEKYAGLRILR